MFYGMKEEGNVGFHPSSFGVSNMDAIATENLAHDRSHGCVTIAQLQRMIV